MKFKAKILLFYIGILAIPAKGVFGYSFQKGKLEIVVNNEAKATIVKPQNSTPRESFAAKELQKYIRLMSGAILPIKSDSRRIAGNVILIGGPRRNEMTAKFINRSTFDKEVPGPEGLMIKTFGSNALVLAGSTTHPNGYQRGTLYTVYEFLERYLGCSFAAYGKPGMNMGEYVPAMHTIKIGKISHIRPKSSLPYRTAIVQYFRNVPHDHDLSASFIDWLAKNRYNRILTMASVYEDWKTNGLLDEAKKRGILFTVGHHESSLLFLPPQGNSYFHEHYYETHPEYYKLLASGKRYDPKSIWRGQWIFNSRNKNAINQVAQNIKIWFSRNPYIDIVCLWPLDGTAPQCQDSICKGYSKVKNYAYFVNEVAKKVNKTYPNKKIDMLIYHDLWRYPGGINLDSSLVIDQANITRTSYGKSDGSGFLGSKYQRNAQKWASAGASVVYYEYYMGVFGDHQVYFPMADALHDIYSYFENKGFSRGVGTQMECYNLWNFIFNFYVNGRTAYNTNLTLSDNLNRFCKIFGKGAPYIKSYFKYVEGFYEGQGGGHPGEWFMKYVKRKKVYNYFEEAYQAEPEGKLRNNIRMLRMAFRYSDFYVNGGGAGELKYMNDHFDSYYHNPGYGISIIAKGSGSFVPNKWYKMNIEN
jgi:hypothetical protein